MSILISILIITLAIVYLQYRIWKVERNIVFPIFTGIFYYWSLAGSWLFAFDNLSGIGKLVGFNYYNLLEKMFLVEYDDVYCQTLWMYGIFILLFQIFIWIGLKRIVQSELRLIEGEKPLVSSSAVSIMALFFLAISVFLVKDVIVYSLILNESVYINII